MKYKKKEKKKRNETSGRYYMEVKIINSLVSDPFITYSPAFTCPKSTMETWKQNNVRNLFVQS